MAGKTRMAASIQKRTPLPATIPNSDIPAVSEMVRVKNAQAVVKPPVIMPFPDFNNACRSENPSE